MKKTIFAILIAGISFGVIAQQQGFVSPDEEIYSSGGFKGPTPGLTTVAQAKTLRDDAWVVLVGHIIKQVGHELYEFKDSSGRVRVEIDDKHWMGQTVSPDTKVRIDGEVDKDWNNVEIDVKKLQVLK
ncbi:MULTISPECIES: YgiW/YdeI family stress tolerance OB fold protein [Pantoea]|jgi:uncharacterized protein (TIGR00156 family)|uniref:YgiW/YdeI family stress tolerance OB fold protein n=1 Tax=Pantoea TaxID=53335 RepID=UPI000D5D3416|nr:MULTISPECIES: YgiW/YdeI family stress tolerance OB fold protein [Pantoea]MCS3403164.1 YgiW/YdeI family stress tolerance OB fold protein [Pantoea sp. B566]MCV3299265.1 YgiW/YdeI family stress tolerance OB fold protein [Pantoea ananatis]PVY81921.1 uncharacterized protein (TIGR00156 family) [Pantoea ananatis]